MPRWRLLCTAVTNSNGQIATDYIQENDLTTTNTNFQKRNGKLWTFMSDCSGAKMQVDYIMVRNKWRNSTKNCEVYNSFSSIGSDHRILTAKIKLCLRATKRQKSQPIYDWTLLKDRKTAQEYTDRVLKRYSEINLSHNSSHGLSSTETETYKNFINVNKEISESLIPKKNAK